jgi:hypothetical protein
VIRVYQNQDGSYAVIADGVIIISAAPKPTDRHRKSLATAQGEEPYRSDQLIASTTSISTILIGIRTCSKTQLTEIELHSVEMPLSEEHFAMEVLRFMSPVLTKRGRLESRPNASQKYLKFAPPGSAFHLSWASFRVG